MGGPTQETLRTLSDLRIRAVDIRKERKAAEAVRREAERLQRKRKEREAQRVRLEALRPRSEDVVWQELEDEINTRHYSGYDCAATLLFDLKALAEENGTKARFSTRLDALLLRHSGKKQFLKRITGLYGPK